MPTYDYVCENCTIRFDLFMTYAEYGTRPVVCSNCGSDRVRRRLTRVRVLKSEESRMAGMESELGNLEGLENDPQALGRMMRKMGREIGEEKPPEFDDVVDRLERGQTPEQIESAMPELGKMDDDGGEDDE